MQIIPIFVINFYVCSSPILLSNRSEINNSVGFLKSPVSCYWINVKYFKTLKDNIFFFSVSMIYSNFQFKKMFISVIPRSFIIDLDIAQWILIKINDDYWIPLAQSFTSFKPVVFIRCLNGTFSWRKYSVT